MTATNKARIDSGLNDGLDGGEAERLLDPAFVERYRREVLGRPFTARGTTHISVIDAAGNAAALTLSNGEGAACVPAGTGIMLNNILGEEDINPRGFHAWTPNRRVSSMMAPTIATRSDGHAFVLGSGGSNRIRTAILQALVDLLVFGMSPAEAAAAPRIHCERDVLYYEDLFGEQPLAALADEFAEQVPFAEPNIFFGGVHVAAGAPGGRDIAGGGDPRRGGAVVTV
jgi:gamma-glutamyltranspeptidase/glutathione hydrolase